MSIEWKEYKTVDDQEYKCTIFYNFDLTAYFLSVIPVEREVIGGFIVEKKGTFTGLKVLLIQVNRRSKKQLEVAIEIAKTKIDSMIKEIEIKNI